MYFLSCHLPLITRGSVEYPPGWRVEKGAAGSSAVVRSWPCRHRTVCLQPCCPLVIRRLSQQEKPVLHSVSVLCMASSPPWWCDPDRCQLHGCDRSQAHGTRSLICYPETVACKHTLTAIIMSTSCVACSACFMLTTRHTHRPYACKERIGQLLCSTLM